MSDFIKGNLQAALSHCFGYQFIENIQLPDYLSKSLNPQMRLRDYQEKAFQYFITYWEREFDFKPNRSQVLFHMATGSGKTLIMAGLMLYLFDKGYKNFLFLVDKDNVIEKTNNNFFNKQSSKYQFAHRIVIGSKPVEIKKVQNFQETDENAINICLATLQGFHNKLNYPKENGLSYADFEDKKIVIISDEAHHVNVATKRGRKISQEIDCNSILGLENEDSQDWETSVMKVFYANTENVLLEFTATEDFLNPLIADKYSDKVIFDYPLKQFRADKYSKDIDVIQSDMDLFERSIQAIIMSQFRRKLAEHIGQEIKPVVMFKSKTIKSNKSFYSDFKYKVQQLSIDMLEKLKINAYGPVYDAFSYFSKRGISLDNLLLELKEDFKEDNLLLIDGDVISPQKQQWVNSLEEKNNEFRAVFAVDMLNEGWDVLNLFDIVRLYDTRDSRGDVIGKTTNTEAQLIGRGARYMPFSSEKYEYDSYNYINHRTKRKFDEDLDNPLRYLEMLHYHSTYNPRYIVELKAALVNSGIMEGNQVEVKECLKSSFKQSDLYKSGYVFTNEQIHKMDSIEIDSLSDALIDGNYNVRLATGESVVDSIFSSTEGKTVEITQKQTPLLAFGTHLVRAVMNRYGEYAFQSLKNIFPKLKSIKEFIENEKYLGKIQVNVFGSASRLANITQRDKFYIVTEVLKEISPRMNAANSRTYGSHEFNPHNFCEIFKDHTYKVSLGGPDKEEGLSMRDSNDLYLRLDLREADWYAYDDNYGTDEEKHLIKYISEMVPRLKSKKYSEIYLVRNYKDFKLYDFVDGRALEPDFVLFLRRKSPNSCYENIQIFIEAKGAYLRANDRWKADFLKQINHESIVKFKLPSERFVVWGMPFFTKGNRKDFDNAMADMII